MRGGRGDRCSRLDPAGEASGEALRFWAGGTLWAAHQGTANGEATGARPHGPRDASSGPPMSHPGTRDQKQVLCLHGDKETRRDAKSLEMVSRLENRGLT